MAEAFAVVGTVSSIVQLIDFTSKCIGRLEDFRKSVNNTPKLFYDVALQLPLLVVSLKRIQLHIDHNHYDAHDTDALQVLVGECHTQIKELKDLLFKVSPNPQDSKLKISHKAIESFRHERTMLKINARISGYIEKFILFQSILAPDLIVKSMHDTLLLADRSHMSSGSAISVMTKLIAKDELVLRSHKAENVQNTNKVTRSANYGNRRRQFCAFVSFSRLNILWAFQASLDVMWGSGSYSVTPSLRLQRVVKYTSPGFGVLWTCENGYIDWSAAIIEIKRLFQTGQASPLDIDPSGRSWLEKLMNAWEARRADERYEIIKMLIENGTRVEGNQSITSLCASLSLWDSHVPMLEEILAAGYDISQDAYSDIDGNLTSTCIEWDNDTHRCDMTDPFWLKFQCTCARNASGFFEQNSLMDAILVGSQDEITRCLQHYKGLLERNLLGQSAVHLAVLRPTVLSQLLQAGAKVDVPDKDGFTPFDYAAIYGLTDSLLLLLKNETYSVCHDENNQQHVVFLKYAMRKDWKLLSEVFSYFHTSQCYSKDFLNTEINHLMTIYAEEQFGISSEGINCLVKLGADPNLILDNGDTLLHKIRYYDAAKAPLPTEFIHINHANLKGISPLMLAVNNGDLELLKAIVVMGGDIHQRDLQGHSMLHFVARPTYWHSFRCKYITALERFSNVIAMTATLLDRGIDPFIRDSCRCRCSSNGCSASVILHRTQEGILGESAQLEWLSMLTQYGSIEIAQEAALDLVRLVKFKELGMTHVCCSRKDYITIENLTTPMDDDEVDEILDEERYLMQELEDFMKAYSNSNNKSPQERWLDILSEYWASIKKEEDFERWWHLEESPGNFSSSGWSTHPRDIHFQISPTKDQRTLEIANTFNRRGLRCYVNESTDKFELVWGPEKPMFSSSAQRYIIWLDYIYKNHKKHGLPGTIDETWYESRKYWAVRQAEVLDLEIPSDKYIEEILNGK